MPYSLNDFLAVIAQALYNKGFIRTLSQIHEDGHFKATLTVSSVPFRFIEITEGTFTIAPDITDDRNIEPFHAVVSDISIQPIAEYIQQVLTSTQWASYMVRDIFRIKDLTVKYGAPFDSANTGWLTIRDRMCIDHTLTCYINGHPDEYFYVQFHPLAPDAILSFMRYSNPKTHDSDDILDEELPIQAAINIALSAAKDKAAGMCIQRMVVYPGLVKLDVCGDRIKGTRQMTVFIMSADDGINLIMPNMGLRKIHVSRRKQLTSYDAFKSLYVNNEETNLLDPEVESKDE